MSFYEKLGEYPACKAREHQWEGCELFGDDASKLCPSRSLHFRPQGDALVCGEGAEETETRLPETVLALYDNGMGGLYAFDGESVCALGDGEPVSAGKIGVPVAVIACPDRESVFCDYAVTASGVYRREGDVFSATEGEGGDCAAYHYERLFTAKGMRVRFSAPLEAWNWKQEAQGAGYLDLPPSGGRVLAMRSYKDKLYLFRERGIDQLRALGDNLNFKVTVMPVRCAGIRAGSVADCGSRIFFFAEDGFYSFNGGTCAKAEASGAELADVGEDIRAAAHGGRYYACVSLKEGGRGIFCADAETGRTWFLRGEAVFPVGGDGGLFACNGALCRLTERGFFPDTEGVCTLETPPCDLGSAARKYLDALTIAGRGAFSVTARSEDGRVARACGKAGETLRFSVALSGRTFSLRVSTRSESAKITGATVSYREET